MKKVRRGNATRRALIASAMTSVALVTGACGPRTSATATEATLCATWAEGLFLPSRGDTHETAEFLHRQIADHGAACGGAS